jgi:hypothetical protein
MIAMWMVRPDFRQSGLGILLLDQAERDFGVIHCLGANPAAASYYVRRGYAKCERLTRYIGALSSEGYAALCVSPAPKAHLRDWEQQLTGNEAKVPTRPTADVLASVWQGSTLPDSRCVVQGLHRNASFWQWRYLDSPGFDYVFFGRPPETGVIVARVEEVLGREELVLRLIEIIPTHPSAWHTEDLQLLTLLRQAFTWARDQGCVAVDFQTTGSLLQPTLAACGLRAQSWPFESDPATSLAPLFQPLTADKPPINVFWRTAVDANDLSSSPQGDWCFAKSDGDMDRPNVLTELEPCT